MGTSYNPKIVTNGLVLNLDPANVKSYPANQDPFVNNVSLMLSMDGANNSTTFIDSSQNALAVTVVGNAQISTTQSKYGGASAYFGGSTDRITAVTTNSTFTGDFTWECWFYPTSDTNTYKALFSAGSETTGRYILLQYGSNIVVDLYAVSQNINVYCGITANSGWHHVALVRSGTTVTLYYDGVSKATATRSGTVGNTNGFFCGNNSAGTNPYNGFIDDLRITKAARYTASFTPPAAPLSLPGRLTDLTKNKYNSTMVNSLTFDSSNGGSILANATNQYFTGSINSSVWTSNISMCAWFKHTGYGNLWEAIFSANTSASFYGSPIMTFNGTSVATRNQIGINNAGVSPNGVFLDLTANHLNKWIYCVITISGTTATIYAFQDGVLSSNSGTLPYTLTRTSTGYYVFRHYDALTTQIFQGNIAKVELYNRDLSANEILQNYNATKGRFGL